MIVSDYMHHDKYLTTIAIIKILSELLLKYPTISILNLFSDGAAQHFKQSFFFNAVTRLPKLLGVEHLKTIYDLFETSRGRGIEGLGGVGLHWNQAAEGDQENPPRGGLNPNEIEFLLNLTYNFVRFLAKV